MTHGAREPGKARRRRDLGSGVPQVATRQETRPCGRWETPGGFSPGSGRVTRLPDRAIIAVVRFRAPRARGKRGGRPAKLKPKDVRMIRQLLKDKTVTATDIAKRFGVSRATVQRSLASYRKSEEAKQLDKLLKAQRRAARAGTE